MNIDNSSHVRMETGELLLRLQKIDLNGPAQWEFKISVYIVVVLFLGSQTLVLQYPPYIL